MYDNLKASRATAGWKSQFDAFFAGIKPHNPDSFFDALPALREIDTLTMARDFVSRLARAYIDAGTHDQRSRLGLDRSLPAFGHFIVAESEQATISFSIRRPKPPVAVHVLSTSSCHEYHRVERGAVRMTQCVYLGEHDGQKSFAPAKAVTLKAAAEIEARAGESAFAFHAHTQCLILSAAGAVIGDFKTNLDALTGRALGQSFSHSRDSILVNVLELCAQFPDPVLGNRPAAYLAHPNHKVRLAALKACVTNNTHPLEELARTASTDAHPLIAGMGKQLLELAP